MWKKLRQTIAVLMVLALMTFSILTGEGVPSLEVTTVLAEVTDIMSK